ncbi:trypsin-like serine peptidase [Micromonospora sp. BQ11]|uniref:trypsin-like serine peptidase n=1 Tax=Micromonospora sp. BQ11 TaxID=3452212 RepID=UPI003F8BBCA0
MNVLRVGLITLVGVASVLAGAGPATAGDRPGAAAPEARGAGVVTHRAADDTAEQRRITDYWTPARMRAARPADVVAPARSTAAPRPGGRPTVVAPTPAPASPAARALASSIEWTGGGTVAWTTGKVFFTRLGYEWVCSGSVVSSANKDMVVTAGHCVHGVVDWQGNTGFFENFVFVPAYRDGVRPVGTFTARSLHALNKWTSRSDFNYDVGIALMNPLNGRDLADTVGAQGITFNEPRNAFMHAFGYPSGPPFDGQRLIACASTVFPDTIGGTQSQGMTCDMTPGSSGGPWLFAFDTSRGIGYVNSVNSFIYTDHPTMMWGPYFGSAVEALYRSTQAA